MQLRYFWTVLLVPFLFLLPMGRSGDVLVWSPLLGRSHIRFMTRIADLLVHAGHNVTLLQTVFDPDTGPEFGSLAQQVIVHHPRGFDPHVLYEYDYKNGHVFRRWENIVWPENSRRLVRLSVDQCRGLLTSSLTQQLRAAHFDLVVFELVDLCPGLWLQYLNVERLIAASSFGTASVMEAVAGLPVLPSFVPTIFSPASDRMSWREKAANVLARLSHSYFIANNSHALRRLGNEVSLCDPKDPLAFLSQKVSAFFINTNEFAETARPVLRNFVFVGGLMVDAPAPPLSETYERLYRSCPEGVGVVSFGSMVHTRWMPTSMKTALLLAFRQLAPLCFVWKVDRSDAFLEPFRNETPPVPNNVFFRSWLPQQSMLADNRTRLFVTHAGANSVNEAFAFGVPVLAVPLYLDNNQNAAAVVRRGLGLSLDKLALTPEALTDTARLLLQPEFTQKAHEMAQQLERHRQSLEEAVVSWSERVMEFGPLKHFALESARMPWWQLLCLDVLVPAGMLICACLLLALTLLRSVLKFVVRSILSNGAKIKTH